MSCWSRASSPDASSPRGEAMLELIGNAMGRNISSGREVFKQSIQSASLAAALNDPYESLDLELKEQAIEDEDEYDPLGGSAFIDIVQQAAVG